MEAIESDWKPTKARLTSIVAHYWLQFKTIVVNSVHSNCSLFICVAANDSEDSEDSRVSADAQHLPTIVCLSLIKVLMTPSKRSERQPKHNYLKLKNYLFLEMKHILAQSLTLYRFVCIIEFADKKANE